MTDSGMETSVEKARSWLRGAWKRRWLAVSVAWAVALLSAALIPVVPQRYEASSRIYVDTQSVLKPLMAGLIYQPDIDEQLDILARTLISRPNLEQLVDRPEFGFAVSTPAERELTLTQLMKRIKLMPADPGNLYTISYRDTQPERAHALVQATIDLFMRSSAGNKRRDSEEATRFITDQIRSYETKLVEAEARLKDFKLRNFGVTGLSNQDYFSRMSTLSGELNSLNAELKAAEQSRDAYRRELAMEEPQLPLPSGIDASLTAQKTKLNELLTRFTELHPDVISARQVLADLEARKRSETARRAGSGEKARGEAATSPVYQRIRVALAESEARVRSLRSRVAAEQRRLDDVRSAAGRMPGVEAELAQLNRDYDIIRTNYDQLVARRESASIGEKLDESLELAAFRVVDPPRVTPSPVFPSHLELAMIAIGVALAAGLLATVVADQLRPTVDTAKSLQQLTGRPVLGTIAPSGGTARRGRNRVALLLFGVILASLLACQAAWLAWVATHPLA